MFEGFVKSLKRWLDQRDAYNQVDSFNSMRPYLSQRVIDRATRSSYAELAGSDSDPEELLPDVEYNEQTSADLLIERREAIERERRRREDERSQP